MNKLFQFIERNLHLIFLVLFQAISFTLLFSFNPYQNAKFTKVLIQVTGTINGWNSKATEYFNLVSENQQLKNSFSDSLRNAHYLGKLVFLDDTLTVSGIKYGRAFDLFPAEVIYNTVHKSDNIFVINRGSKNGIKKSMGVMSPNGVAGIVIDVSDDFATVMSILHSEFKLIPQIDGQEFYSSIEWKRSKPEWIQLNGVNKQEKVKKGTLITTGRSSIVFPEGMPIGTIDKLYTKPNSQYFNILITPSTNFRKLRTVFVIKNRNMEILKEHVNNNQ